MTYNLYIFVNRLNCNIKIYIKAINYEDAIENLTYELKNPQDYYLDNL